jgi:AcrR family transcriptional regulator
MRVDAARNRAAVLAAAGRLFDAATDPDRVSMDDIAAAAGVGKGTLFRGFGDRIGLIRAVWQERAEELAAAVDAAAGDPAERVLTILVATWEFKARNRMLGLALENAGRGSPYGNEDYGRMHALLAGLLDRDDADFLAHALLAAVRSDLVEHLRDQPAATIRSGLAALVDAVF